jgi:hypothetical protein
MDWHDLFLSAHKSISRFLNFQKGEFMRPKLYETKHRAELFSEPGGQLELSKTVSLKTCNKEKKAPYRLIFLRPSGQRFCFAGKPLRETVPAGLPSELSPKRLG